ncbi:MAG: ribonuclease P protein component [Desulfovibrio sp.]|nr:ribonuclease P protein component [Desulfovibrio sp.]
MRRSTSTPWAGPAEENCAHAAHYRDTCSFHSQGTPEHSVPQPEKLRRRADFLACYDRGSRHYSEHFLVFLLAGATDDAKTRLGLAVSRKVGKAVVRNRIKRLLREFFRLHANALPARADLVAVAKKNAGSDGLNLERVKMELWPLLRRIARNRGV